MEDEDRARPCLGDRSAGDPGRVRLEDLQRAAVTLPDSEREAALELVVDACHCGRAMLKALGYYDLAWIAVERARETAERLGDPLLRAASTWNQAEVYLATGAVNKAIELCLAGIGELDGEGIADSPPTISLVGKRCSSRSSTTPPPGPISTMRPGLTSSIMRCLSERAAFIAAR